MMDTTADGASAAPTTAPSPVSAAPSSSSATPRSLYGGALSISLPARFEDVSPFRDVPNHQEVMADADTDQSIIIELNQYLDCPDDQAATEHINELARVSSTTAADSPLQILSTSPLPLSALPLFAARPPSYAGSVVGEMRVSKYHDSEAEANLIMVYMIVIRLREQQTDLLLIYNVPTTFAQHRSDSEK